MKLLIAFLNGKFTSNLESRRYNPKVIHYYNEIVRFWNKINFIIKKVFPNSSNLGVDQLAKYLYVTYRIMWEDASTKALFKEIKGIDKTFLKNLRTFSLEEALWNKDEKEKLSILEGVPSFMIRHLLPYMALNDIKNNVKAMNWLKRNNTIQIRINRLLEEKYAKNFDLMIETELKKMNIAYSKDSNVEDLLTIPLLKKYDVIENHIYKKGLVVFQDKASAAVIEVLSPQPRDFILDMCAAPGIKTSLIAQRMNNNGHLIAGEFLKSRIKVMKQLLYQLNVSNTHILNVDSIAFPSRFDNFFDRILLDAPCTGSGTFLTNPELKWRQNQKFLRQSTVLQRKLFESALKILKPEGILVYSTCSLYPEEGEHIILDFFNKLSAQTLPDWFSPSYLIKGSELPGTGRLFPSIHNTKGFFIGKFKKKEI